MATGREETVSKKHQSLDGPLSLGINRKGPGGGDCVKILKYIVITVTRLTCTGLGYIRL